MATREIIEKPIAASAKQEGDITTPSEALKMTAKAAGATLRLFNDLVTEKNDISQLINALDLAAKRNKNLTTASALPPTAPNQNLKNTGNSQEIETLDLAGLQRKMLKPTAQGVNVQTTQKPNNPSIGG